MISRRKFNFWVATVGTFFLLGRGASARAQEDPVSPFLGTKTPYQAPAAAYTPPPEGFSPVFINYVGRHGARFLTKAGADLSALKMLEDAARNEGLTELGGRVEGMVRRFCVLSKGRYENISRLGREEQQAIGQRLWDRYSGVFTGKGLEVIVTYKVRTQQSADAFLHTHTRYKGKIQYYKTADSLDTLLRFYDLSPAYAKYAKGPVLKKALDSLDRDPRTEAVAERVCSRLFTPAYRAAWKGEEGRRLTDDLYDLYTVQFSLSGEMKEKGYPKDSLDLGVAFGRDDLDWEDFRSGAEDFLAKGPGRDPLGIQVKVAGPLLEDFIRTTQRVVRGGTAAAEGPDTTAGGDPDAGGGNNPNARVSGNPDAILRFTHAEAISPFAALLGISGANSPASSVYDYRDHWRAASVIPLSANIQWILYSNGREYLVKVLLNEREVSLPIGPGPYYRWPAVKQYYRRRLEAIGVVPGQGMREYLRELIN